MSQNSISSNELTDQIMSIVENSNVASEQKSLLREVFQNLARHQCQKLDNLKNMVHASVYEAEHTTESIGRIVVALLPKNYNLRGFSPVVDFSQLSFPDDDLDVYNSNADYIGLYFKCSYDRFLEIVDSGIANDYDAVVELKNGSRLNLKCSFRIDYSYIYQERILQTVASQYGFETPLIYSPYSRRFARIILSEDLSVSQITAINIPVLAKDIIATTLDYDLMWNIEVINRRSPELSMSDNFSIEKKAEMSDSFVANEYVVAGSSPSFKSKYSCYPNEYILFDGVGTRRLAIARDKKESFLFVMYDGLTRIEPIKRLKVNPINDINYDLEKFVKENTAHLNSYNSTTYRKRRLCSKADIIYSLSVFQQNEYDISIDSDFELIEKYPSGCISDYQNSHRYYQSNTDRNFNGETERSISNSKSLFCCLTFKGSDPFIEDFARYVLSYMNEQYPEFHWVGRCG
ncbi:hypothetical protein RASY3_09260 [Ruminococcus albus SY3]|uniref:Normocyte-binding protein n=1 Tax=Ruminococcus albus SY3 TaxID=1341156 RepID=A0A011WTB7_RUMAL|nr:hypothetical protein [Ruminococcus albus]EXM40275.1 hypothetical protein RASY3_09260 [Ruminococcus albus SY3]